MHSNQYTLTKHTILPLIYRILSKQQITYLIKQPQTRSLIMFASTIDKVKQLMNDKNKDLKNIEQQSGSQLKYIMFNQEQNIKSLNQIRQNNTFDILTAQSQGDLKPLVLGDLTICFIDAKGYKNPFSLIAVTHLTENSTKFPILFPGTMLSPCSIDYKNQESKPSEYIQSLQKIKYFPNQTYIFPINTVSQEDLIFAKALNSNQFIDEKIALFKKNQSYGDALIPTTVLQQKMMNPFLTTDKFKALLGTSDRIKSFDLLRRMRKEYSL